MVKRERMRSMSWTSREDCVTPVRLVVLEEILDDVQAPLDLGAVEEGLEDVALQSASSHGGPGVVEHREQGPVFRARP